MMMNFDHKHIARLLLKQSQEGLTDEEKALLVQWEQASVQHRHFSEELQQEDGFSDLFNISHLPSEQRVLSTITQRIHQNGGFSPQSSSSTALRPLQRLSRWWIAASVLALAGISIFYLTRSTEQKAGPAAEVTTATVIGPGSSGAILTLSDGSQIVLDSMQNGQLTLQGGTNVLLQNDSISYASGKTNSNKKGYNTVSTPKGRQFRITLPDGSRVWLNAASSLRFPTVFNEKDRKVEISGEAYFEIVRDQQKPFLVNIDHRATVEVVGTHFNIFAYNNEQQIQTTLLEGAVRIAPGDLRPDHRSVRLKPGQQANILRTIAGNDDPKSGTVNVVNDVDIAKVMSWKDGMFNFEGLSLQEVMRQLERWYDIEVVYENPTRHMRFFGKMDKNVTLNELLQILSNNGLRYKLQEGKKLIIL